MKLNFECDSADIAAAGAIVRDVIADRSAAAQHCAEMARMAQDREEMLAKMEAERLERKAEQHRSDLAEIFCAVVPLVVAYLDRKADVEIAPVVEPAHGAHGERAIGQPADAIQVGPTQIQQILPYLPGKPVNWCVYGGSLDALGTGRILDIVGEGDGGYTLVCGDPAASDRAYLTWHPTDHLYVSASQQGALCVVPGKGPKWSLNLVEPRDLKEPVLTPPPEPAGQPAAPVQPVGPPPPADMLRGEYALAPIALGADVRWRYMDGDSTLFKEGTVDAVGVAAGLGTLVISGTPFVGPLDTLQGIKTIAGLAIFGLSNKDGRLICANVFSEPMHKADDVGPSPDSGVAVQAAVEKAIKAVQEALAWVEPEPDPDGNVEATARPDAAPAIKAILAVRGYRRWIVDRGGLTGACRACGLDEAEARVVAERLAQASSVLGLGLEKHLEYGGQRTEAIGIDRDGDIPPSHGGAMPQVPQ